MCSVMSRNKKGIVKMNNDMVNKKESIDRRDDGRDKHIHHLLPVW